MASYILREVHKDYVIADLDIGDNQAHNNVKLAVAYTTEAELKTAVASAVADLVARVGTDIDTSKAVGAATALIGKIITVVV